MQVDKSSNSFLYVYSMYVADNQLKTCIESRGFILLLLLYRKEDKMGHQLTEGKTIEKVEETIMFGKPEILANFYGEYKAGILGKKNSVSLYIYEKFIEGTAAVYSAEKMKEYKFDVKFENIKAVEEKNIDGSKCLAIDYINGKTVINEDRISTILFPNIQNFDEAMERILCLWEKNKQEQRMKLQEEQEQAKKQLLEQQQHEEECQTYFIDCYNFHIGNENNPYYELQSEKLQFAGIYIDKNKNLNFLKIDGYNQDESNACIPYEKIHYYERAGSVHYITDINGNYSNFGGSFTGATVSTSASIVGGLLFGPMGMATGALLTHKPMEIEPQRTSFNISSQCRKIDDTSVILNYYSDKKQQLMDIELPADIYNFLQTYLPERKYGIVLELEKKSAVKACERNRIHENEKQEVKKTETNSDDVEQFEKRIKKLKIMYENGLLLEEEYVNEKKRILSEL